MVGLLIRTFISSASAYIISSFICDHLPNNTTGKVAKSVIPVVTGSVVGGVLLSTPSHTSLKTTRNFTATMIDTDGNVVDQVSDGINDGRWMDIYLDSNNNVSTIDISGM